MKHFSARDSIVIHAPIERCFLLSTNVALVQKTLGMKPAAGRTCCGRGYGAVGRLAAWLS